MREILFRGLTKDSKWATGSLLHPDTIATKKLTASENIYYQYHEVNPKTVGEFTGLLDKNGNKVFEGDILADGSVVEWFDKLSWDSGGSMHSGFYTKQWAGDYRDGEYDLDYHSSFRS